MWKNSSKGKKIRYGNKKQCVMLQRKMFLYCSFLVVSVFAGFILILGMISVFSKSVEFIIVVLTLFLCSMLGLSYILSRRFAAPILKSLSALQRKNNEELSYSGIKEVDEVIEWMQELLQEQEEKEQRILCFVREDALPPNIEELFQEFADRVRKLTPTEHTILQYYIEGYSIEEIAEISCISINTARKHNTNMNRKLGLRSKEELSLYIELFRRGNRLDEISHIR